MRKLTIGLLAAATLLSGCITPEQQRKPRRAAHAQVDVTPVPLG